MLYDLSFDVIALGKEPKMEKYLINGYTFRWESDFLAFHIGEGQETVWRGIRLSRIDNLSIQPHQEKH